MTLFTFFLETTTCSMPKNDCFEITARSQPRFRTLPRTDNREKTGRERTDSERIDHEKSDREKIDRDY